MEFRILGPIEVRADGWDAASREGAAMSFADAIAYALDEPNG